MEHPLTEGIFGMPVFDVGDWTVYPGARETGHVWTGFYSITTRAGIEPLQRFPARDVKSPFATEQAALEAARYEGRIVAEGLPKVDRVGHYNDHE